MFAAAMAALLVCMVMTMVRAVKGPTVFDRILALNSFGTKTVLVIAVVNFLATSYQGDRYGHSYFRDAPSVSSDLVLMLRDDLDPGPPGRPLEPLGNKFWRVPPAYPAAESISPIAPAKPRQSLFVH